MPNYQVVDLKDKSIHTSGIYIGYDILKEKIAPIYFRLTDNAHMTDEQIFAFKKSKIHEYLVNEKEQHYILFYRVDDAKNKTMKITDFFKAVLINPKFYVDNMFKQGQPVLVVDEFSLKELARFDHLKQDKKPFGCYLKALHILNHLFDGYFAKSLESQLTYESFKNVSNPSEV